MRYGSTGFLILGGFVAGFVAAREGQKPAFVGRMQKIFEKVSRLPRRQQDKVIEFVEAFVAQQVRKAARPARFLTAADILGRLTQK